MGDGCNMEGISNEAASLAGHWGLGRLIVFYDDNRISIDGNTDISFTEDVSARHVALGWHVQHVVVSHLPRAAPMHGPTPPCCPFLTTICAANPTTDCTSFSVYFMVLYPEEMNKYMAEFCVHTVS